MSCTESNPNLSTIINGDLLVWKQSANCKGKFKLFFAHRAERPQARYRREAKAHRLCAECSVKEECKDFARNSHEYGYWGGENEEDRHLAGFTVAAPIGIRAREAIRPAKMVG
ncbi:MAG: WhiB family transcriptional regulator [Ilumatobacteraceae bacterium]